MERVCILILSTITLACVVQSQAVDSGQTILSAILTPSEETDEKSLLRPQRSYYDRYEGGRPLRDRVDDDRPSRCGRCDDRYDDKDDYDRPRGRDRYDDDRRSNRPTYGNRYDRNKNYDGDDNSRTYDDRKTGQKNGTDDENNGDDKKRPYDDKDRHSGGRRGHRDRDRDRYDDDRDRYRYDYYDRFLRDPYRDRFERPYYDDLYRERRPLYDRYPYDRYDDGYGARYEGYGYPGYRRQYYDDRYDRGNGYEDVYGGYGPSVGRGQHDSFRPWDETYRGQSGWDAGGRGYYFASGRPDAASSWAQPLYSRPESSGWQNVGYSTGYRDPAGYRGSVGTGYSDRGYQQNYAGYGQSSGWQNVGERRPYRDQSGVNQLDNRGYRLDRYGQSREPIGYAQPNTYQPVVTTFPQSTTPGTSYLHEREDQQVTKIEETTKTS